MHWYTDKRDDYTPPFPQIGSLAYIEKTPKRARAFVLREATRRARHDAQSHCRKRGEWHATWTSPGDFLHLRPDVVSIPEGSRVAVVATLEASGKIARWLCLTDRDELPRGQADLRLMAESLRDTFEDGDAEIARDVFNPRRLA